MVNGNLMHELEVLSQKDIINLVTKQQRDTPMKKKTTQFLQFPGL